MALLELLVYAREITLDALCTVALGPTDVGPKRAVLAENACVVPRHDVQLGKTLAGNGVDLSRPPVAQLAQRLRQLVRAVGDHGRHDQVVDGLGQVLPREFAHLGRHGLEGLPIVPGLPRRIVRRRERMEERVEVGAGEVVLLVPVGGGQHDVRVVCRRVHSEVDIDH